MVSALGLLLADLTHRLIPLHPVFGVLWFAACVLLLILFTASAFVGIGAAGVILMLALFFRRGPGAATALILFASCVVVYLVAIVAIQHTQFLRSRPSSHSPPVIRPS